MLLTKDRPPHLVSPSLLGCVQITVALVDVVKDATGINSAEQVQVLSVFLPAENSCCCNRPNFVCHKNYPYLHKISSRNNFPDLDSWPGIIGSSNFLSQYFLNWIKLGINKWNRWISSCWKNDFAPNEVVPLKDNLFSKSPAVSSFLFVSLPILPMPSLSLVTYQTVRYLSHQVTLSLFIISVANSLTLNRSLSLYRSPSANSLYLCLTVILSFISIALSFASLLPLCRTVNNRSPPLAAAHFLLSQLTSVTWASIAIFYFDHTLPSSFWTSYVFNISRLQNNFNPTKI